MRNKRWRPESGPARQDNNITHRIKGRKKQQGQEVTPKREAVTVKIKILTNIFD